MENGVAIVRLGDPNVFEVPTPPGAKLLEK